jgi:disulfide bond formation protein DsbB
MSVDTVNTFFAAGAVLGFILLAGFVVLVWAARSSESAAAWRDVIVESFGPYALMLAAVLAIGAVAGSLYYSEIVDWEPCEFCWYQRTAMYPLAVITAIAVWRRDHRVGRYVYPLAIIGAGLAAYHYTIQSFPSLAPETCSLAVPCTTKLIWKFGFVSMPLIGVATFGAIVALVWIDRAHHRRAEESENHTGT